MNDSVGGQLARQEPSDVDGLLTAMSDGSRHQSSRRGNTSYVVRECCHSSNLHRLSSTLWGQLHHEERTRVRSSALICHWAVAVRRSQSSVEGVGPASLWAPEPRLGSRRTPEAPPQSDEVSRRGPSPAAMVLPYPRPPLQNQVRFKRIRSSQLHPAKSSTSMARGPWLQQGQAARTTRWVGSICLCCPQSGKAVRSASGSEVFLDPARSSCRRACCLPVGGRNNWSSSQSGAVAQWSEQGTHNPSVAGSIPACPTDCLCNSG